MSKAIDAATHGGALPTKESDTTWHDRKKWAWMLGLVVPTIPFGTWVLHELTDSPLAWWYGPVVIFLIFPVIDTLAGLDGSNPPDSLLEALEDQKYYRYAEPSNGPIVEPASATTRSTRTRRSNWAQSSKS